MTHSPDSETVSIAAPTSRSTISVIIAVALMGIATLAGLWFPLDVLLFAIAIAVVLWGLKGPQTRVVEVPVNGRRRR